MLETVSCVTGTLFRSPNNDLKISSNACILGLLQKFCSEKRACTGLVLMAVVNFLINIPHFATYEPVQQDIRNNVEPSYRKSQFGKSEGSHHYEFWVHCIFLVFGPWIGILILNIFIIRQVAGVNKNIGRRRSIHGNKKTQRAESQLTRILLSVSFAFLILIFPECIAKCFFMLKAVSRGFEQYTFSPFKISLKKKRPP